MIKDIVKEHYEWDNKRLVYYILGELPLERSKQICGKRINKGSD